MHRELDRLGVAHMYEEFPDNHSSVDYRMDISLPFLVKALSALIGIRPEDPVRLAICTRHYALICGGPFQVHARKPLMARFTGPGWTSKTTNCAARAPPGRQSNSWHECKLVF